ncbi:unnamed protein product, partial [Ectocarpus sp. 12 AP-2014]
WRYVVDAWPISATGLLHIVSTRRAFPTTERVARILKRFLDLAAPTTVTVVRIHQKNSPVPEKRRVLSAQQPDMTTRGELSVGGTTNVPSLADQIKRFQPRVFSNTESASRAFDRSAKDNPAREALTIKCVKVIVDNFERLPAHDATGGFNIGYRKDDGENGDRRQDETKD